MAVGENLFPSLRPIRGCRLSAVAAGIRYQNRNDLALIELCEGSVVAGCFTQNIYQAAPVVVAKSHIQSGDPRYLLINSGNANACTGEAGDADAITTCARLAGIAGVEVQQVLPFSTGVIGERLNMEAFEAAIPDAFDVLDENAWLPAAQAIMTTDTFPKGVTRRVDIDGKRVTINGIAKGAGMIRPDMATMLAYVVTDAVVSKAALQSLCQRAVDQSFNRVTVDGDTSTNDAAILAATNTAGHPQIDSLDSTGGKILCGAIIEVFVELAQLLVRDGEGATKFVTVNVAGGACSQDCLQVAYTVAQSPLVKTALFASDPNWGRIVAAIGRSGVPNLKAETVKVWLDDVLVVENAGIAPGYSESQGQSVLNRAEFVVTIDLGVGDAEEVVWTCDLSHEYVSINADYRS